MMVSKSIGSGATRPLRCSASTPPTVASGKVSSTSTASLREAKTPQQNEQYHHGEQEDAAEVAQRLLQAVGIAGDPQLPGRQQRPDGGKALVLQGVEHLLHAHPRRGEICRLMLRRPSDRKMLSGPSCGSTRSSSQGERCARTG